MQVCTKCEIKKPRKEFYRRSDSSHSTGHCKVCIRKRVRLYRLENRKKIEKYFRKLNKTGGRKRALRVWKKEWKTRNPEKVFAQTKAYNAIRDGRLKRKPCEKCGKRAQAHHPDYSKPLKVKWLCTRHHADEHLK